MNLQTQTDEVFAGFIEFGEWMDSPTRKGLVRLLVQFLIDPDWQPEAAWNRLKLQEKAPVWAEALGQLLRAGGLRKLTAHNEALTLSVAQHALDWLRNTHRQAETEAPERKGFLALEAWRQRLTAPAADWQKLLRDLEDQYPEQRQWGFYHSKLRNEDDRTQILLRQNILHDWQKLLDARQQAFAQRYVREAFTRFESELRHRYTLLNQLGDYISPFFHFLGDDWGQLEDSWEAMPWADIENYVALLKRDPHLRQLVEMLGRWQQAEEALHEASLAEVPMQTDWKPRPYGRSEIVGVTQSDHLEAVLPSELALLSHPETEWLLALKYVEKKLLTFQYRSQEADATPRVEPELEGAAQKGPIILCIDTSGSMFGKPEIVAKAVAFAVTSRALKEERPCYLISFSTEYKSLELTNLEGKLEELIGFIRMSFHGGTDIKPALEEALRMVKEHQFHDADVLVVSDFLLPRVPRQMLDDIQEQRNAQGTRFHSLYVSRRIDPRIIPASVFDHQWVYNLDLQGGLQRMVGEVQGWLEE